jgi:phosphoserine phosphatase RsbU/P
VNCGAGKKINYTVRLKQAVPRFSLFIPIESILTMLSDSEPLTSPMSSSSPPPSGNSPTDIKPILALKELVASLYREQNKVQNLLSSLGFALRSFNNLNQFLDLTPLMAARVADAEGGALVLSKPNGQVSLEQLHCQDNGIATELRLEFEALVRQINQEMTASGNGNRDAKAVSFLDSLDYQIRKTLGAGTRVYSTPILVKNSERGRLYVFSRDPDYSWTPTRRKLLQLVADQTAVAMANNELTIELRSKERQDRELEIASEIQARLLPRQCPKIIGVELAAHCKTANRVGGDYYDFIPSNYDRLQPFDDGNGEASTVPWSIVIGDVMGKGVPAGLLMTMTRGMLRAEVLNRHSPSQILTHLNRVMYADLENSHRFVTLFYSEYDPRTRVLSYSNAAHYPPLLWRAKTGEIDRLDTEGMLVGLEADSVYQDGCSRLEPGDTLIYYTDGFTDAVNSRGERFDEANWVAAVRSACQHHQHPEEILKFLFETVAKFTGLENDSGDDMTLVVMRVQSN